MPLASEEVVTTNGAGLTWMDKLTLAVAGLDWVESVTLTLKL